MRVDIAPPARELGMEFGVPGTMGTPPAQTPDVFSRPPSVWYAPPLAPYRYPRVGMSLPYISAATTFENFAAAALTR